VKRVEWTNLWEMLLRQAMHYVTGQHNQKITCQCGHLLVATCKILCKCL